MATTSQTGMAKFDGTPGVLVNDWLDQFEVAISAAGVDNAKKKATLLIHVSPTVFKALKNRVLPQKLTDDTKVDFAGVIKALQDQYHIPPSKPLARNAFAQLRQAPKESIADFGQRLRAASVDCEFAGGYDERMMDQLPKYDEYYCGIPPQRVSNTC
jgi:hypothetical protein